jgi:hypothetical protein
MDAVALASAFIAASVGKVQLAAAGKMLQMQFDGARSAVQLIDTAQQNVDRLANVAAGIGSNVDITA